MTALTQAQQETGQPMDTTSKIELARTLLENLEQGKDDMATLTIAQLAGFRDSLLFQEIGRMTRELHESIKGFMVDSSLAKLTKFSDVVTAKATDGIKVLKNYQGFVNCMIKNRR